eukprot:3531741-Rhodomonas_salina.2
MAMLVYKHILVPPHAISVLDCLNHTSSVPDGKYRPLAQYQTNTTIRPDWYQRAQDGRTLQYTISVADEYHHYAIPDMA